MALASHPVRLRDYATAMGRRFEELPLRGADFRQIAKVLEMSVGGVHNAGEALRGATVSTTAQVSTTIGRNAVAGVVQVAGSAPVDWRDTFFVC